ncbi:MAG: hypothetical protein ACLUSV_01845 [Streptococcus sp.]
MALLALQPKLELVALALWLCRSLRCLSINCYYSVACSLGAIGAVGGVGSVGFAGSCPTVIVGGVGALVPLV